MTTPSNDVLDERFRNMEKQNSKDHKELFKIIEKLDGKLDSVLVAFEKRYASKRVEWVVKGVVGLILVGVFGGLLKLVLK